MKLGYKVAPIHGDMTQQQRERVMKQFKDHSLELLIATDVAARGIDVDNVTHVIHHSLPDESAYYSHRSGRTARAGKDGITIAMISKREERRIRELERELSISFEHIKIPTVDEIKEMRISKWLEEFVNEEWKPNVESFLVQARELLMQLNKEEIIDKLLNKEFASLLQTKNTQDLNEPQGRDKKERGDRSDRGERDRGDRVGRDRDSRDRGGRDDSGRRERTIGKLDTSSYERRSSEGSLPFFINLGGNDGLKKGELLKLVCDTTNLKSKDITRLKILDKHSFFDVIEDRSSRVASSFKNVKYQGREVKVNRDFPKGE
jgi:ATP-dependent RNA helicase DeaD